MRAELGAGSDDDAGLKPENPDELGRRYGQLRKAREEVAAGLWRAREDPFYAAQHRQQIIPYELVLDDPIFEPAFLFVESAAQDRLGITGGAEADDSLQLLNAGDDRLRAESDPQAIAGKRLRL